MTLRTLCLSAGVFVCLGVFTGCKTISTREVRVISSENGAVDIRDGFWIEASSSSRRNLSEQDQELANSLLREALITQGYAPASRPEEATILLRTAFEVSAPQKRIQHARVPKQSVAVIPGKTIEERATDSSGARVKETYYESDKTKIVTRYENQIIETIYFVKRATIEAYHPESGSGLWKINAGNESDNSSLEADIPYLIYAAIEHAAHGEKRRQVHMVGNNKDFREYKRDGLSKVSTAN